jgi:hypothetical protein
LTCGASQPVLEARQADARVIARYEALIVNLYAVVERLGISDYRPCVPGPGTITFFMVTRGLAQISFSFKAKYWVRSSAWLGSQNLFHRLPLCQFIDQFIEIAYFPHRWLLNVFHPDAANYTFDQSS